MIFRSLWRNLAQRNRVERDLDAELHAVFDLLVEEKVGAGMSREEARRAAGIELGQREAIKDRVRDVRAGALWDTFRLDLRHATRLLARSPMFTVFAVASLSLGIGATAAIFTLFDNIVLRKLSVHEPDRLVVASFGRPGGRFNYSMPYPQFERIGERATTIDGIFATNPMGRVNVGLRGDAAAAEGMLVSGHYYQTLGLTPALGRLLDPSTIVRGNPSRSSAETRRHGGFRMAILKRHGRAPPHGRRGGSGKRGSTSHD